jgi:NAD(P)-dependent dehydrogenase (short-subunit alcohol dehydrogenase family)
VIAQQLAAAGAAVAIVARTSEQLEQTASLIETAGGSVSAWAADVTDGKRINEVMAAVEESLGPITLLVNNAGRSSSSGPVWEGDPDEWWRDVEINLRGPFLCTRAVLPRMISRRKGRIVNIASNAGIRPTPYATAYSCSKAALLRFTDSVAESVKALGVQVFAISPGWVWTAMTERTVRVMKEKMPDFEGIPESQVSPPELAANLVVRLASGEADNLTGRYIHVTDDLDELILTAAEIQEQDLYALRLKI